MSSAYTVPAELAEIRKAINDRNWQLGELLKDPNLSSLIEDEIRHARADLEDAYGSLTAAENLARRFGPKRLQVAG